MDATRTLPSTADNNELELPRDLMSKRGSLTSAKSLHEFKHTTTEAKDVPVIVSVSSPAAASAAVISATKKGDDDTTSSSNKRGGIRPSKSDTSLTESFVVVDNEYKKKYQNALREGKQREIGSFKMFS